MVFYIKYMVSHRCKMMVKLELKKLKIRFMKVDLGMVEVLEDIKLEQREQLNINLKKSGLELLDNQQTVLVENIRSVIKELFQSNNEEMDVNYSEYLSEKLDFDYTYLANVFSDVKGITIQQYIIQHKIEKVKELILYDGLTLTEIAARLHYSSVAHLSNQFKKITGHTPTFYKEIANKRKENLDKV